MATAVWSGAITFGLLSIPIRLYAAARTERIAMHLLDKKTHSRIKQPYYCEECGGIVLRSELQHGYEYEKGEYVIIEDEDLKKITPPSSKSMEILAFVKEEEIDPIYFDASYFAMPDKKADKPYVLLLKALERTERAGIAKLTMHQREYTVFVRPRANGLTVHTMYYANEIRKVEGYGEWRNVNVKPQEMKLAEQFVETLAEPFRPEAYRDSYQENLKKLIAAKRDGKTVVAEKQPRRAPVIDIMEALRRSVRQSGAKTKKPASAREREEVAGADGLAS
jgi:DNA end-binding protein Ku